MVGARLMLKDEVKMDRLPNPGYGWQQSEGPIDFSRSAWYAPSGDERYWDRAGDTRTWNHHHFYDGTGPMPDLQYSSDVKIGIEELCPVCGDKVSGYHYGLQTCESCKGFFKRTVQNKKVYSCVDNRACAIDKTQRKRCPYCRFQKCLSVGMKLEAVRADRMRGGRNKFGPMYKRDRALKQQAFRQQQQLLAQCSMQLNGGMPISPDGSCRLPNVPNMDTDIKPDISMLMSNHPMAGVPTSNGSMMGPMHGGMHGQLSPHQPQQSSPPSSHPGQYIHGHGAASYPPNSMMMPGMTPFDQAIHGSPPHGHNRPAHHHSPSHHHLSHQQQQQQHPQTGGQQHHHAGQQHRGHPPQQQQQQQQHSGQQSQHQHSGHHSHNQPQQQQQQQQLPPPPPQQQHQQQQQQQQQTQQHSVSTSMPTPVSIPHMLPTPPLPTVPQTIKDLHISELSDDEISTKLNSVLQSELTILQQFDPMAISMGVHSTASFKDVLQLLCKISDQCLFLLVEWARTAHFFKDLKVEDQMKLLQNCWSELLILDFIYRQSRHNKHDHILLPTGQMVSMDIVNFIGLDDCRERLQEILKKFRDLKVDHHEYTCLKFLILLNPDVFGLLDRHRVEESQEKVNSALLDYCSGFYPHVADKFGQVLVRLPEIRLMSLRAEEYLYFRHISRDIEDQTLLTEMLHAKRK